MILWHLCNCGVTWGKESAHPIAVVEKEEETKKVVIGGNWGVPQKGIRNLNNKRGDSKQNLDNVEEQMV